MSTSINEARRRHYPGSCFTSLGFCFTFLLQGFLLRHGGRPRDPRGRAMPRQAVMPFKNVDAEPCFACGATENTRCVLCPRSNNPEATTLKQNP